MPQFGGEEIEVREARKLDRGCTAQKGQKEDWGLVSGFTAPALPAPELRPYEAMHGPEPASCL